MKSDYNHYYKLNRSHINIVCCLFAYLIGQAGKQEFLRAEEVSN